MSNLKKLTRSVIFTPSDRESAMRKAISVLNADVVVFDLEDAVSPDQKENARKNVVNFLSAGHIKRCSVVVRVNCPKTTKWGQLDIAAISNCFVDALILPKVEEESTIKMASEILRQKSSSGKI
jgi:citrate lyase beta subunit